MKRFSSSRIVLAQHLPQNCVKNKKNLKLKWKTGRRPGRLPADLFETYRWWKKSSVHQSRSLEYPTIFWEFSSQVDSRIWITIIFGVYVRFRGGVTTIYSGDFLGYYVGPFPSAVPQGTLRPWNLGQTKGCCNGSSMGFGAQMIIEYWISLGYLSTC